MDTLKKEENFDVAVIGGGAAGMMAAIVASGSGLKVAILEKNPTLGKKLLITGNGRCNITQINYDSRGFIEKLGRNGKFLFSSLSTFGPQETIGFFENLGIKLKTERNGRVFPISDKAQDVLNILQKALKKNGVKVMCGQNVGNIKMREEKIEFIETKSKKIYARNFIITTGGKSYPATGSTGDGYLWLENIGHTIISPTPALAPIKIYELWIKNLQGISLKNVGLRLIQNDKKIKQHPGEILFTHFGLSGPAIINASRVIGEQIKKGEVFLELDLLPALNITELEEKLKKDFEDNKKKNLKNYLADIFPERLAEEIIKLTGIETEKKIGAVTRNERLALVRTIKGAKITAEGLLDFNHAMVTSGGVSLKEIDPKTMRSKIVKNLFLAGEILDLDGPTGGYNLQIAWTTGHAAGAGAKG